MNSAPAVPAPSLAALSTLDRLRELASSPARADCLCVTARCTHGVKSVTIEQPTLLIVLRGEKRLRAPGLALNLHSGDLLVGSSTRALDVTNQLDEQGIYLTLLAPLCTEVIDAARLLWSGSVLPQGDSMVPSSVAALEPELLTWCDALQAGQSAQARLALASVLLRLCAQGHTALLVPPPPSFSAQVRAIVSAEPARDWRSRDFEAAMGLSGATLRRRLSQEQTSLTDVVTQARLAQAMELLYTTRWPIKTIAARVGYRSAASFTRRFSQRYGLEPSEIGNAA